MLRLAVVFGLLAGFFALDLLLYPALLRGEAGLGWDLVESYWPDLAYLAHGFARGEFPLWNPYERAGYPVHADPQPAMFYPVQWLFALLGAAWGETSWWLIQCKCLLHDAIAATTLTLFLRSRACGWPSALFGGLALLVSGTWLGDKSNNFFFSMAWTPLLWLATDRLFLRPGWRSAALLAGALYLSASSGSPPGYFYTLLMALLYGGFRLTVAGIAIVHSAQGTRRAAGLRLLAALLLVVVLSAGLQAILFAHTGDLVTRSARVVRDDVYVLDGLMGMLHSLIGLVAPISGTPHTYIGLAPIMLAVVGLVLRPRRDVGAALVFVVSAVFFLLLAFGRQTPLLGWLSHNLPGFNFFRVCARYRVPYGLMLAVAAGYGLDTLLTLPRARLWRALALIVLGVLGGVTAWVIGHYDILHPNLWQSRTPSYVLLGVTLVLGCAVTLLSSHRLGPWVALAFLPLVYFDAPGFVLKMPHGIEPRVDEATPRARAAALPDRIGYRVFDEFVLAPRAGSRLLIREFRAYPSHDPLSSMDYRALLIAARTAPAVLGEINVRYLFHAPYGQRGWGPHHIRRPPDELAPGRIERRGADLFEILHPAPWVAWYGAVELGPRATLPARLGTVREANGLRRVALIANEDATHPDYASAVALAAPGSPVPPSRAGRVLNFEPERVVAEIEAPARGIVVLNEAGHPGWKVWVDGVAAPLLSVDVLLRGVVVEPGHHRIEWRYEPRGMRLLSLAWFTGLMVVLMAMAPRFRSKKTGQTGAQIEG